MASSPQAVELTFLVLFTFLVVGPKEIAVLASRLGRTATAIGRALAALRGQFNDLARRSDLENLREHFDKLHQQGWHRSTGGHSALSDEAAQTHRDAGRASLPVPDANVAGGLKSENPQSPDR